MSLTNFSWYLILQSSSISSRERTSTMVLKTWAIWTCFCVYSWITALFPFLNCIISESKAYSTLDFPRIATYRTFHSHLFTISFNETWNEASFTPLVPWRYYFGDVLWNYAAPFAKHTQPSLLWKHIFRNTLCLSKKFLSTTAWTFNCLQKRVRNCTC